MNLDAILAYLTNLASADIVLGVAVSVGILVVYRDVLPHGVLRGITLGLLAFVGILVVYGDVAVAPHLTLRDIALGFVTFIGVIFVAIEGYKLNLRLLKHSARDIARDLQDHGLLDHHRGRGR